MPPAVTRPAVAVAAALLAIALAACASGAASPGTASPSAPPSDTPPTADPTGTPDPDVILHPTGATDVVLRAGLESGFVRMETVMPPSSTLTARTAGPTRW